MLLNTLHIFLYLRDVILIYWIIINSFDLRFFNPYIVFCDCATTSHFVYPVFENTRYNNILCCLTGLTQTLAFYNKLFIHICILMIYVLLEMLRVMLPTSNTFQEQFVRRFFSFDIKIVLVFWRKKIRKLFKFLSSKLGLKWNLPGLGL